MKSYTEAKNVQELTEVLGLPKIAAAKIEMRTNLVIAIRRVIEKKSWTHLEAAKRAQVGRTVITAVLNGNTTHVSTDRLIDIAQRLGLKISLNVA